MSDKLQSGSPRLRESIARLERYRQGKRRLDARLYDEAMWWQSRHETAPAEGDSRRPDAGLHSTAARTGRQSGCRPAQRRPAGRGSAVPPEKDLLR